MFDNIVAIAAIENFFKTQVFTVIIALLIFIIILKLLHMFMRTFTKNIIIATENTERKKEITTIYHVAKSTIDIVLWLTFGMALLTKIGVDIRPILAAAGVLGVAVGFGARRFVEDVITGIIILLEGQIRVGDVVEIGSKSGVVEKIDLKMVVLRDNSGKVYFIRNGMIDIITNMTRDYSYYMLDLKIDYNENIDNVTNVIKDVFNNELLVLPQFSKEILEPVEILGVDSFEDSAYILKLRVKTKPMSQWSVGREFNKLIKNKFEEKDIKMSSTSNTLYIAKNDALP